MRRPLYAALRAQRETRRDVANGVGFVLAAVIGLGLALVLALSTRGGG